MRGYPKLQSLREIRGNFQLNSNLEYRIVLMYFAARCSHGNGVSFKTLKFQTRFSEHLIQLRVSTQSNQSFFRSEQCHARSSLFVARHRSDCRTARATRLTRPPQVQDTNTPSLRGLHLPACARVPSACRESRRAPQSRLGDSINTGGARVARVRRTSGRSVWAECISCNFRY